MRSTISLKTFRTRMNFKAETSKYGSSLISAKALAAPRVLIVSSAKGSLSILFATKKTVIPFGTVVLVEDCKQIELNISMAVFKDSSTVASKTSKNPILQRDKGRYSNCVSASYSAKGP
eukprot:Skav207205  [mRNA]  locus=scaffold2886:43735:50802:+ [translate_table: standard]